MARRSVLTLVLVPLVLVGAWSLGWLLAARQVQTVFHHWIAAREATGWRISEGRESLAGWPWSATVKVADLSINGGADLLPGGLVWQCPRLALEVNVTAPGRLLLIPSGRQRIHLFGGPAIVLAARRIEARLEFAVLPWLAGSRRPGAFAASASAVRLGPADGDPTVVTAERLSIEATPASRGGNGMVPEASLRLRADGISVAHAAVAALGPEIAVFSFSGAFMGRVPSGANWATRLGSWRDHGGMVAVRGLTLVWGPLAVGASGRLTLDDHLQPAGEGTARVVGYAATLDALAGAGTIGSGVAVAAKTLLTLMARPSTAGGPPEVDVPLSLEDRTLSLGQIPLVRLPSVTWPGGS